MPRTRKGQEGHVRAECDVLKPASLVSSPGGPKWVVRLHHGFQDMDNLYLVRSPVFMGLFLTYLLNEIPFWRASLVFMLQRSRGPVDDPSCRVVSQIWFHSSWYQSECAFCSSHLELAEFDVFDPNFLFDLEGHSNLKLSDFGLV